jgi:hypothetical protein
MPTLLKDQSLLPEERAKYQNVDFSDLEVEVMLKYFNVPTHQELKSLLEVRRKSFAMTG